MPDFEKTAETVDKALFFSEKNKIKHLHILTCYAILKQDKVLF